jgi:hypothetical protein
MERIYLLQRDSNICLLTPPPLPPAPPTPQRGLALVSHKCPSSTSQLLFCWSWTPGLQGGTQQMWSLTRKMIARRPHPKVSLLALWRVAQPGPSDPGTVPLGPLSLSLLHLCLSKLSIFPSIFLSSFISSSFGHLVGSLPGLFLEL